jgi:hypothetical protein
MNETTIYEVGTPCPGLEQEERDHDMWRWNFTSWLGAGTQMWLSNVVNNIKKKREKPFSTIFLLNYRTVVTVWFLISL